MKKRKRKTLPPWTPFEAAEPGHPSAASDDRTFVGTFVNSRYQVSVNVMETPLGEVTWLSIINRDRSARHDWRDFQRIKNELMGPEREAIELYPAESRLVDTNNQFHLFVIPKGSTVPVGYRERDVGDEVSGSHKQRPFAVRPKDANEKSRRGEGRIAIFGKPVS